MKKRLIIGICIIFIISLNSGCSIINSNLDASGASDSFPPPPRFSSIDDFHDNLIITVINADVGSQVGVSSVDGNFIQANDLNEKQYYFIPSWIPDGFELDFMSFSRLFVGSYYKYLKNDDVHGSHDFHDFKLDKTFSFVWFILANAKEALAYDIEELGLIPANGVEGLYYEDYGAYTGTSEHLMRTYYWIQAEYFFKLSIPLWTISGEDGNVDEYTANQLIMNSALKVDIVADELFKPPTDIELDETEAELEVSETIELVADVTPHNATIDAVFWNSSDNRIATVD